MQARTTSPRNLAAISLSPPLQTPLPTGTIMRVQTITLLLLLLMLAWAKPAHAARSYDNCTGFITSVPAVISTPGTWCLKQDVTTAITSGHAISVASDNVTIDCNDFRLDGLAGGLATTALGIHSLNESNVRVRHCNIRGFYRGVFFEGTGGRHVVEDNHFDQNPFEGMRVNGDGSVVRHNLITDTGGGPTGFGYGIAETGTVDVIDNTIVGVVAATGTNSPVYGIRLDLNVGGSIVGNRVEGLVSDGTGATPHGIVVDDADTARLDVRRNLIIGSLASGTGVACNTTSGEALRVRVRDNVINGFLTANSNCADAGENDITP
jgi:hypothetical protein